MPRSMLIQLLLFASLLAAAPASAGCYADYKAKRDAPLRLHYGVVELPQAACNRAAARSAIARRIAREGWQLLEVVSIFDDAGLSRRRPIAGRFFLRY